MPPVRDVLRARARASQLLVPKGVLSGTTAARLLGLQGLRGHDERGDVHLTLAPQRTRWQRRGIRLHWSRIGADDVVDVDGLRVTSATRTLRDLEGVVDEVTFVCLADSAVHQGLIDDETLETHRNGADERSAARWRRVDGRSESPSETRVRLVLVDGGLAPEELQLQVRDETGRIIARLDMSWKRRRVGLEVDSGEHDRPKALYATATARTTCWNSAGRSGGSRPGTRRSDRPT